MTHAAFKAPLFLSAGIAGKAAGTYRLREMWFGRALPWTAGLTGLAALALAAVPPMGAAWSKEQIAAAAMQENLWLRLAVMAAGALSAAYAARFWFLAYGPGNAEPEARPHWPEIAALDALALACIALGLLWLAPMHDRLPMRLPEGKPLESAASLVLVAIGLLAGLSLARRDTATELPAADWLGLPILIGRGIVRPFERLAALAARLDDTVLDAIPRGVARGARRLARGGRWFDTAGADAVPRGAVFATGRLAKGGRGFHGMAQLDRARIDAAIWRIVTATKAIARWSDHLGEPLSDGLPEGAARITGQVGADARRLQTGLSHHYCAIFGIGAALAILLLIFGKV